MREYSAYIGLDVHKDTIAVAVAVALPGRVESAQRQDENPSSHPDCRATKWGHYRFRLTRIC